VATLSERLAPHRYQWCTAPRLRGAEPPVLPIPNTIWSVKTITYAAYAAFVVSTVFCVRYFPDFLRSLGDEKALSTFAACATMQLPRCFVYTAFRISLALFRDEKALSTFSDYRVARLGSYRSTIELHPHTPEGIDAYPLGDKHLSPLGTIYKPVSRQVT